MKLLIVLLSISSVALAGDRRIIGGNFAKENQFPHQVAIFYHNQYHCGGSILDSTTILTAGHCLYNKTAKDLYVAYGNIKLSMQTERRKIERYVLHERYVDVLKHDIAIIKLSTPIVFRNGVQPIKLRRQDIGGNVDVVVAGWGWIQYDPPASNDLKYLNLKTITVQQCSSYFEVTSYDQLCVIRKPLTGPCSGDSGSALVDGNGEQVGIVSRLGRPGLCAQNYPDIFVRVYSYLNWIERNRL